MDKIGVFEFFGSNQVDGNDKPTVEEADSKKPEADQRSESASLELKENRLSVR